MVCGEESSGRRFGYGRRVAEAETDAVYCDGRKRWEQ